MSLNDDLSGSQHEIQSEPFNFEQLSLVEDYRTLNIQGFISISSVFFQKKDAALDAIKTIYKKTNEQILLSVILENLQSFALKSFNLMLDEQLAYFYNAKDGNKSYTNYDDEEFQIFDNDNWIRGKITNDERKLNMSSVGSFMEQKTTRSIQIMNPTQSFQKISKDTVKQEKEIFFLDDKYDFDPEEDNLRRLKDDQYMKKKDQTEKYNKFNTEMEERQKNLKNLVKESRTVKYTYDYDCGLIQVQQVNNKKLPPGSYEINYILPEKEKENHHKEKENMKLSIMNHHQKKKPNMFLNQNQQLDQPKFSQNYPLSWGNFNIQPGVKLITDQNQIFQNSLQTKPTNINRSQYLQNCQRESVKVTTRQGTLNKDSQNASRKISVMENTDTHRKVASALGGYRSKKNSDRINIKADINIMDIQTEQDQEINQKRLKKSTRILKQRTLNKVDPVDTFNLQILTSRQFGTSTKEGFPSFKTPTSNNSRSTKHTLGNIHKPREKQNVFKQVQIFTKT